MSASRRRQCVDCGRTFTDATRRCQACRAVERVCEGCGCAFVGTTRRCSTCQAVERVCECGRTFTSHMRRCSTCRAVERVCECGRTFTSHHRRCEACRAVERVCEGCGCAFVGTTRRCWSCRVAAYPPELWRAMAVARGNARRARVRAAEVAGPVPAEVYAAIRRGDDGPCVYCGAPVEHVDHVRPIDRGGWEHVSNLVPACGPCNVSKRARLLTEWDPERVERAALVSPRVAAELARLLDVEAAELAAEVV